MEQRRTVGQATNDNRRGRNRSVTMILAALHPADNMVPICHFDGQQRRITSIQKLLPEGVIVTGCVS